MAVIGPGAAPQALEDIKPLLEGATEYEYVTILNPLTDDFAVRVGQDVPVNMPTTIRNPTELIQKENDVVRNYGIGLKGKDFVGRRHIVNDTIIPAGKTINLKGNEAQVAVRQLVAEILQREGNSRLIADPNLRLEVEKRIIISRGSVQDILDGKLLTPQNQIDEAIRKSNEVYDEQPFPDLEDRETKAAQAGSSDDREDPWASKSRGPGRPRKDQ